MYSSENDGDTDDEDNDHGDDNDELDDNAHDDVGNKEAETGQN